MEARHGVVTATAIALAAAVALLWFLFGQAANDVAPGPAGGASHQATAAAAEAAVTGTAAQPPAPVPAAAAEAVAPAPARREVAAPGNPAATLRGRCVDGDGRPLGECKVHLHGWGGNSERMDQWLTDHGAKPDWQQPADVITAADGAFVFRFWPPPPFQFALDVTRDGCGAMSGRWSTLAAGSELDVGDVTMSAGVQVTGRVVDPDGVPQGGEYVSLERRGRDATDRNRLAPRWGEQTTSRADGTFVTRDWLVPGEYEVRTQKGQLQSPKTVTLRGERPREELTIVVAAATAQATITGRVLDETGRPVVGIDIEANSERGSYARTTSRRDGTFELRRRDAGQEKATGVSVVSHAFEVQDGKPRQVEWGTTGVEFRVTRAGALTLRVSDPQQAPVETYTVRLIPRNRNRWSSIDARVRTQGRHPDGTAVIEGLSRGDWLLLVDFPAAFGCDGLFVEFTHEGGPRRMDLRALPSAVRTVRVVAGDDAPVAGTKVQLCETFEQPLDQARLVMQRDHWLMNAGNRNALVLYEGTTGADGRVELRGPPGRILGICVPGPGHVPIRMDGVRIDLQGELVVRVSRGARLTGRIVPPEAMAELKRLGGDDPAGGFSRGNRPRLSFANDTGARFPTDHVTASNLAGLQIADDGTFAVDGVPPGTWKVQVQGMIVNEAGSGGMGHHYRAGEVTLVDGQTTDQDLDLAHVLPGTVEGLVLLNGQPLADQAVSLRGDDIWITARTDGSGRFVRRMFAGDYQLAFARIGEDRGSVALKCPTPVRVGRGQTTAMTFALASTQVRITVLDAAGKPVADARLHALGGDPEGSYLPPTDAAGVVQTELGSETVVLRILPRPLSTPEGQQQLWRDAQVRGDRDPLGPHWIALRTVVLAAGQQSDLEVRLPASAGY